MRPWYLRKLSLLTKTNIAFSCEDTNYSFDVYHNIDKDVFAKIVLDWQGSETEAFTVRNFTDYVNDNYTESVAMSQTQLDYLLTLESWKQVS